VSVNDRIPANVFLNRNFLLLWAAYGIAAIGDNMNDTGQLALVNALETEKSVRLMALMMFGLMLPFLILGPVAGWAADRISRQLTMISADVIRGVIVLNFATIIPWLLGIGFGDYTVMSTQIMLGMLGAFFSPARQAMLPTLVRHDQLVTANGMIGAIAPIGAVIGFLIGGIIVDQAGPVWNFRINAVTFLSSATLIAFIIVPRGVHQVGAAGESMLAPLLEGFAYVRSHRRVLSLIAILSVFWGAAGVVYACVPAIVTKLVSDKYTDVGTYRALTAMGMIPGAVLMSLLGKHLGIKVPLVGRSALCRVMADRAGPDILDRVGGDSGGNLPRRCRAGRSDAADYDQRQCAALRSQYPPRARLRHLGHDDHGGNGQRDWIPRPAELGAARPIRAADPAGYGWCDVDRRWARTQLVPSERSLWAAALTILVGGRGLRPLLVQA
jgi:MFS family permease